MIQDRFLDFWLDYKLVPWPQIIICAIIASKVEDGVLFLSAISFLGTDPKEINI